MVDDRLKEGTINADKKMGFSMDLIIFFTKKTQNMLEY